MTCILPVEIIKILHKPIYLNESSNNYSVPEKEKKKHPDSPFPLFQDSTIFFVNTENYLGIIGSS